MEWISVEERLPEDFNVVLGCLGNWLYIGYFISYGDGSGHFEAIDVCDCDLEHIGSVNITHWMPLPEPPNEQPSIVYADSKEIDKIMKINLWLMNKYGVELRKEFGLKENDFSAEGFQKIAKVFDYIYKKQNEKTPLMWYEYGISEIPEK